MCGRKGRDVYVCVMDGWHLVVCVCVFVPTFGLEGKEESALAGFLIWKYIYNHASAFVC